MEVVACLILIHENNYLERSAFERLYAESEKLSAKILAMKNAIKKRSNNNYVNEEAENYGF
jgi:hypothetical protein